MLVDLFSQQSRVFRNRRQITITGEKTRFGRDIQNRLSSKGTSGIFMQLKNPYFRQKTKTDSKET